MSHQTFNWRGTPSIFANASQQGQGATPGKNHPLRRAEAQKVGSASRAPTASINTEPTRIVRTKGAAI